MWMALCLILGALLAAGCGTIYNVASGNLEPYGGVEKDAEFLEAYYHPGPGRPPSGGGGGRAAIAAAAFLALPVLLPLPEFTLSFCADTATLPLTLYVSHVRNPPVYVIAHEDGNAAPVAVDPMNWPRPYDEVIADPTTSWDTMARECLDGPSTDIGQEGVPQARLAEPRAVAADDPSAGANLTPRP
jgi:hypothetical protein